MARAIITAIDELQPLMEPPALSGAAPMSPWDSLFPALRNLDRLLEWATRNMQVQKPEASAPFRGLYVSSEDVARVLRQDPGSAFFHDAAGRDTDSYKPEEGSPLAQIVGQFGLTAFDTDVILLALAPELDLRYERIFSYLQDDVTRKRPTVELALHLLCSSPQEKLERRASFSRNSALIREGLLHLFPDPNQVEPPLLAHYVRVDESVTRQLLSERTLDSRLAGCCELHGGTADWKPIALPAGVNPALAALVRQSRENRRPLRLYFQGPRGTGKLETAEALAASTGVKLLLVRADRLLQQTNAVDLMRLLLREARLQDAILYVRGFTDTPETTPGRQDFLDMALRYEGITILAGKKAWEPRAGAAIGVQSVSFDVLNFTESCACWESELATHKLALERPDLELVASRFRLTTGQIRTTLANALLSSEWRSAQLGTAGSDSVSPTQNELCAAARAQCGHELACLTNKIEPRYGWDDIILPVDQIAHLREICGQAEYRKVVYEDWGFDRKLSLGKGLNVLFSGPPGVGKTMAAEVMARELQLDIYRIDLSQVVSKYIGESEKNLEKIFNAAENSNAILFFDEADALFGKRSEVHDSHDRYANIEISYLLQKMEEYLGISILATNLRQNLDAAFMRRLQAVVEFPFPDETYRVRIWERSFPKEAPLAPDVDFTALAREVHMAGGNIKNMALAAAFYAAGDGGVIRMEHLIRAANREHQKIGRSWDATQLG